MDVLFNFYGALKHNLLSCSLQQANTICLDEDISLEMIFQVAEAARGKCVSSSPTTDFLSQQSSLEKGVNIQKILLKFLLTRENITPSSTQRTWLSSGSLL